jgi:hypothetical protein
VIDAKFSFIVADPDSKRIGDETLASTLENLNWIGYYDTSHLSIKENIHHYLVEGLHGPVPLKLKMQLVKAKVFIGRVTNQYRTENSANI